MYAAKQYNQTFSIMKGIGIISVVLGHCPVVPFIGKFVNQYHLAVFFFVAGYFFKDKYIANPKKFFLRRLKSLYIPYIAYGLLFLCLHNVFYYWHIVESYRNLPSMILGGAEFDFFTIF